MLNKKIKIMQEIKELVKKLKSQNKKIAFCNGCFDVLHIGHIKFLEEAKKQGDVLIVGLNSDSSVKENKSPKRPINTEENRANILASLEMVDYVVIFSEKTPINLIETIKPDVFVNGAEYGENCVEAPIVKKYGGKIHLVKNYFGLSTTELINKISDTK